MMANLISRITGNLLFAGKLGGHGLLDVPAVFSEQATPPGSSKATNQGCTCPRIDNHYGSGRPNPDGSRRFTYHADCPLHGIEACPWDWART